MKDSAKKIQEKAFEAINNNLKKTAVSIKQMQQLDLTPEIQEILEEVLQNLEDQQNEIEQKFDNENSTAGKPSHTNNTSNPDNPNNTNNQNNINNAMDSNHLGRNEKVGEIDDKGSSDDQKIHKNTYKDILQKLNKI